MWQRLLEGGEMAWHCWFRFRRHKFTGRWILSGRRSVRLCEACIFGRQHRSDVMT